ncbi:hypothetical protein ACVWZA_001566 [Sphingomonas sp. UYAg733]
MKIPAATGIWLMAAHQNAAASGGQYRRFNLACATASPIQTTPRNRRPLFHMTNINRTLFQGKRDSDLRGEVEIAHSE